MNAYWAMSKEKFKKFCAKVSETEIDYNALKAREGQILNDQGGESYFSGKGARSYQRGDIAILEINGALMKNDDIETWWMGFQTYESLALEFNSLLEDSSIQGIILEIDSPGGMVAGINELSEMIFNARGKKPKGVITRGSGDVDSAAYWLGSSAEKIYIDNVATVGSIGVVATYLDYSGWEEINGIKEIEIVSSNAPNKRVDITTEEGQSEIRKNLDDMEEVFISSVARNRGVTLEKVKSDFGQGGVLVGQSAIDAGLADGFMSLEGLIESMNNPQVQNQSTNTNTNAEAQKVDENEIDEKAIIKAERERIQGIIEAFSGTGFESDAQAFIDDGKTVAEAQSHLFLKMKEAKKAETQTPKETPTPKVDTGKVAGAMVEESGPAKEAGSGGDEDDEEVLKAKVKAAFVAGVNSKRNPHQAKHLQRAVAGTPKGRV